MPKFTIWKTHNQLPALSHGFTMVELLISVSIMLLMVGGGVAAFISFNDRQQLQGSTKMLQTYMRTAQTKARVGDRPEACARLEGYAVQAETNDNELSLVALCEDDLEVEVQSTELEGVERIETPDGALNIEFNVLHGGVGNEGEVTLYSDGGRVETFTVSAGGEIGESTQSEVDDTGATPTPTPTPTSQTAPSPSPSPSASPGSQ